MKVKWESNSRVKRMAAGGVIDGNDIIKRTTTNNFPTEAATVRLLYVSEKMPWVTVHINGRVRKHKSPWPNAEYAKTMRVSFGREFDGDCVSGELSEELDFAQVHEAVLKVKEAMGK